MGNPIVKLYRRGTPSKIGLAKLYLKDTLLDIEVS
jgi:hypothetical protein